VCAWVYVWVCVCECVRVYPWVSLCVCLCVCVSVCVCMFDWLALFLIFTACPGASIPEEEQEPPTGQEESPQTGDTQINASGNTAENTITFQESFTPNIQISSDQKKLRFSYTFFRNQDIDVQNKQISIPCSYRAEPPADGPPLGEPPVGDPPFPAEEDDQLTVPIEKPCDPFVLDLKDAEFTLEGIVINLPEDQVFEKFVDDFEIEITPNGVVDVLDGSIVEAEGGTFEDYYQAVLSRRD